MPKTNFDFLVWLKSRLFKLVTEEALRDALGCHYVSHPGMESVQLRRI